MEADATSAEQKCMSRRAKSAEGEGSVGAPLGDSEMSEESQDAINTMKKRGKCRVGQDDGKGQKMMEEKRGGKGNLLQRDQPPTPSATPMAFSLTK